MTFQETLPESTVQLPPQLSTIAPAVDDMYYLIFWISVVSFILIMGVSAYFLYKYRRSAGAEAKPPGHATVLEIFWTFSPLILLVYLFHAGFQDYVYSAVAPEDSRTVRVRGMQWNWEFEHEGGVVDAMNVLQVPVGEPVRLLMSSSDVLHSFFVPTFRVKRDVVPGMWTQLWFEATHETPEIPCESEADCPEYHHCGGIQGSEETRYCALTVFCAEYCGAAPGITRSAFYDADGAGRNTNHSTMIADLYVRSVEDYDSFLELGPPPPPNCAALEGDEMMQCWGESLYQGSGCTACHAVDGERQQPAPNWGGLWNTERNFADGTSAVADAEYIRASILNPQSQIVDGYTNLNMPPYRFSERQLEAITAYIQSLGN